MRRRVCPRRMRRRILRFPKQLRRADCIQKPCSTAARERARSRLQADSLLELKEATCLEMRSRHAHRRRKADAAGVRRAAPMGCLRFDGERGSAAGRSWSARAICSASWKLLCGCMWPGNSGMRANRCSCSSSRARRRGSANLRAVREALTGREHMSRRRVRKEAQPAR